MVWEADAAGDLVAGLSDWPDGALASLLGGLMNWRGRDREEVATVATRLRDTKLGGWNGGGPLGDLLGVRAGAMTALKGRRADWGVGGGGGIRAEKEGGREEDGLQWPPRPPDASDPSSGLEELSPVPHEEQDGYSADAD